MAYKNKEDEKKYYKQYYEDNKVKKQEQKKALYLKNKEEILKKLRDSYVPHPKVLKTLEEKKKKRATWCSENKEKYNAYMREWQSKNKDRLRPKQREYYHTKLSVSVLYQRLHANAKERNYECTLSKDDFTNIISKPCVYCGENEKRIGIDRKDSLQGYTKENSSPCCKVCNYMKRSLTVKDFLEHIAKIYNKNILN